MDAEDLEPYRTLALGIELDGEGAHPAAWRRAGHPPAAFFEPRRLVRLGQIVERAGFGFASFEDDLVPPGRAPDIVGRLGAMERAAFLATALSALSLVPASSTTYAEPFHIASQLASIDHLAAGRSGWLVTVSSEIVARAWDRPPVSGQAALQREATDAIDVVRRLWDSWEDDAVVRDVAASTYLDRSRLHYIDFEGDRYSVKGPAIVPRSPRDSRSCSVIPP